VLCWGAFVDGELDMKVDAEELVELRNHGSMKLRCAVDRAMLLAAKERRAATIVRQSEPPVLNFKVIKHLSDLFRALGAVQAEEPAAAQNLDSMNVEAPFVLRLRHLVAAALGDPPAEPSQDA
jgi:hypothetical protein